MNKIYYLHVSTYDYNKFVEGNIKLSKSLTDASRIKYVTLG